LRTVQDALIVSDDAESQPKAVVRFEINRQDMMANSFGKLFQGMEEMFGQEDPRGERQERNRSGVSMSIHMGEDSDVSLKEVLIDERFESACQEFFDLCEGMVNGIYESARRSSPDQMLHVEPKVLSGVAKKPARRNPFSGIPGFPGMGDAQNLEKAISIERPNVTFDDIGGIPVAKRLIARLSVMLERPDVLKRHGVTPPRGVLLVGPPGTGKTLLAKALANKTNAKFYHVKVSDVLTMWYGESEANVSRIFDLAKENSPAVIFFDEIDALGRSRGYFGGGGGDSVSSKVVNSLCQNMDGLEELSGVIVLAATNRKDDVDSALLRAGRFNRHIPVPLPDEEGLRQIFSIHTLKPEKYAGRKLFDLLIVEEFIPRMRGMSGADVEEVIRRTLEEKAFEELDGKTSTLVLSEDISREIKLYELLKKQDKDLGLLRDRTKSE
jgi:AAA+ superfamily predicted ATPase